MSPSLLWHVCSSFEPPSLEISSSSHHSWRLLLFKPLPLPWAASFWIVLDSVEFIVLRVLLLVGSWCDKCGFARGSLRKVESTSCVRESFCLGRSTSKGECLRDLLAGPSWEGFDVRTFGCTLLCYWLIIDDYYYGSTLICLCNG